MSQISPAVVARQASSEQFQVSAATGGVSWRLPFDLPSGANGVNPDLGLEYNSLRGNDVLGVGFAMAGIQSVALKATLGAAGGEAVLSCSGLGELVQTAPGRWRPRYAATACSLERRDDGAIVARFPSGEERVFGAGAGSRRPGVIGGVAQTVEWMLDTIDIGDGDIVTFTYDGEDGNLLPAHVTYGAYCVDFDYEARPDPVRRVSGGEVLALRRRLRAVRAVFAGAGGAEQAVRDWELVYDTSALSGASVLREIRTGGSDERGVRCALPTTTVSLTDDSAPVTRDIPGPVPDRIAGSLSWEGNGVPALYSASGGELLVWPNRGGALQDPVALAVRPGEIFDNAATVAFSDIDGDGGQDLVVFGTDWVGHYPFSPAVGFDPAVPWDIPEALAHLRDGKAAVADVDGNGGAEIVYFDGAAGKWRAARHGAHHAQAGTVDLTGPLPPGGFDERRIVMADMSGDGFSDLVLIESDHVAVWDNLGNLGFGAQRTLAVEGGEDYFDPQTAVVMDLTGSGGADLYVRDGAHVHIWLNQSGERLRFNRTCNLDDYREGREVVVCDWFACGRPAFVYPNARGSLSACSPFGTGQLDALACLDNGCGMRQKLAWSTTAVAADRAALGGNPWTSQFNFAQRILHSVELADQADQLLSTASYSYRDPVYLPAERRFVSFTSSEVRKSGEQDTLVRTRFLVPAVPAVATEAELALAGRVASTRLSEANAAGRDLLATALRWEAVTDPAWPGCWSARLVESTETRHDGQGNPYSCNTMAYGQFDRHDQCCDLSETREALRSAGTSGAGAAHAPYRLRTVVDMAEDPRGRFLARRARIRQYNGQGGLEAHTRFWYDDAEWGQVGARGRVTRMESQVFTDEQAGAWYGGAAALEALGYHRLPGESGWWRTEQRVQESVEDGVRSMRVADAFGAPTVTTYDRYGLRATRVVAADGSAVEYQPNYRCNAVARERRASGYVLGYEYDGLGRLSAVAEEGSGLQLHRYSIDMGAAGMAMTDSALIGDAGQRLDTTAVLDGLGREVEQLVGSGAARESRGRLAYDRDGRVATRTVPAAAGDTAAARWSYTYDALGRVLSETDPTGRAQRFEYDGLTVRQFDGAAGERLKREWTTDCRGFVLSTRLPGATPMASSMRYDLRGAVLTATDAAGNVASFEYDLLGRRIVSQTSASGREVAMLDARDMVRQVRRNHASASRADYDLAGRCRQTGVAGRDTQVQYDYGAGQDIGRLVGVTSEAGTERRTYDTGGRMLSQRFAPAGRAATHELRYGYRPDGVLKEIVLPNGSHVRYEFDQLGRIAAIPGFVKRVDYAPGGAIARVEYANGVVSEVERLADRATVAAITHSRDGVALERERLTWSAERNVTAIERAAGRRKLIVDELDRILGAGPDGQEADEVRAFDGAGRLAQVDGLQLRWDSDGRLASAGSEALEWNASGALQRWGKRRFEMDGNDRVRVVADDTQARHYLTDHNSAVVAANDDAGGLVFYAPSAHFVECRDGTYGFIYLGELLVARVRLDAAGFGPVDYIQVNTRGDAWLVTDSAGTLVQRIDYSIGGLPTAQFRPIDEARDLLWERKRWSPPASGYLHGMRLYAPALGGFLSADPVAFSPTDPLHANRYLYARGNALRYRDPSGLLFDSFWQGIGDAFNAISQYIMPALLLIACVALIVFTGGSGAILAGMIVGGIMGGIAAVQKGGDVLVGVLSGALLGGLGAFAGAAAAGLVGGGSVFSAVFAGAIKGSIAGAAVGMAVGYAGGAGDWNDVLSAAGKGALTGAIAGAVLGYVQFEVQHHTPDPKALNVIDNIKSEFGDIKVEGPMHGQEAVNHLLGKAAGAVTGPLKAAGIELAFRGLNAVMSSGAWPAVAMTLITGASGYQAGGFGKPLERVIWEDLLNQHFKTPTKTWEF